MAKQERGKEHVYKGNVVCPRCQKIYYTETLDENNIKNPIHCFECFMTTGKAK